MKFNKRLSVLFPLVVLLFFAVLQGCGSSWQSKVKEQLPVQDITDFIHDYPEEHDLRLAVEKGLGKSTKEVSDDYKLMQALYEKAFFLYLEDRLDIKKYDEELANSELKFISHESNNYLGTKYFLFLNQCYIEQLDKSDLELLRRTIETGNAEVTEELADMVQRTWPDIIKIRDDDDNEENFYVMINNDPYYKFFNNAVVLGIGTVKYEDENGNVDMRKEDIKADYLEDYCARITEELDGKLGDVPISVFSFIK